MKQFIGVLLIFFIAILIGCEKRDNKDNLTTFHEDPWIEEHELSDYQSDFLHSVHVLSIEKGDIGYFIKFSLGPEYFDVNFALLGENNSIWSIGPYDYMSIKEKNETTFHITYKNGPYEEGRFDISKNSGEITYINNDTVFGYFEMEDAYMLLSFNKEYFDGIYHLKKIEAHNQSTLHSFQVDWVSNFRALDEDNFLIVADIDEGKPYQQYRFIIIDKDGNIKLDQTTDEKIKTFTFFSSFIYIHYQNNHIKMYNFNFDELVSYEPLYRADINYRFVTELEDGVVVSVESLTEEYYIKLYFDGNIDEDFDYIEIVKNYEITYEKDLVFLSNEDIIKIERTNGIFYLIKEDKEGNTIYKHELGALLYEFDVYNETIVFSVNDGNYQYITYDFDGNLLEKEEITCGINILNLDDDQYLCMSNTELNAFDSNHVLQWSLTSYPGIMDIYLTTFGGYLIKFPEGYDPNNTLPIVTQGVFALVSKDGEVVEIYDDYRAIEAITYDERTFLIVNSNDITELNGYVYEINDEGEIINTDIYLVSDNRSSFMRVAILDQDTLRFVYIPHKR